MTTIDNQDELVESTLLPNGQILTVRALNYVDDIVMDRQLYYVPTLSRCSLAHNGSHHSGYVPRAERERMAFINYVIETEHARPWEIYHLTHLEVPLWTWLHIEDIARLRMDSPSFEQYLHLPLKDFLLTKCSRCPAYQVM